MFPTQLLHRWIPLCRIMKNTSVHILDKKLLQSRICGWEQPLVLDCLIQPLLNKIPENGPNILPSRRVKSYICQLRQSLDCSSSTWMRWSWGRGIAQMDCGSPSGLDGDCMNPSMRWFLGGHWCRRRLRSGSVKLYHVIRSCAPSDLGHIPDHTKLVSSSTHFIYVPIPVSCTSDLNSVSCIGPYP